MEERFDETALEVDASILPGGDEFLVGARDLREDPGAGSVGDLGLHLACFVVEAVLAGAEAGAVDVAVGVEVDQSLAPWAEIPEVYEVTAGARLIVWYGGDVGEGIVTTVRSTS